MRGIWEGKIKAEPWRNSSDHALSGRIFTNAWGAELVLLHYAICPPSLFTHLSSKHWWSDCDPGEVIHFQMNQLFQITHACCPYQRKITPLFFLSWIFGRVFYLGKQVLVSFSCCGRFHSKLPTMEGDPGWTANLLQGLLWCQVKGVVKGVERGAEGSPGIRTHGGPLVSTSTEKQPVGQGTAQTWGSQGRVQILDSGC